METALGALAAALLIGAILVRLVETWRAGSVSGLSSGFLWLALLLNVGWAAYGWFAHVPAQLYPSVLAVTVFAYSLVRVHRGGRPQGRWVVPGLLASALLVGVAGVAPDAIGYVSGLLGAVATVPQIVLVWRSGDRAGVAPWAWAVSLVMAATWCAYGLVAGLTPVWTANAVSAALCTAVLAGYLRARSPAPAP